MKAIRGQVRLNPNKIKNQFTPPQSYYHMVTLPGRYIKPPAQVEKYEAEFGRVQAWLDTQERKLEAMQVHTLIT